MNRIYKKRPFYATLGMELTRYLLISFVLSVSLSVLLYFAISFVSIYTPDDKGFLKQEMQTTISAFQDYVSQNEVASTDYDGILAWNNANCTFSCVFTMKTACCTTRFCCTDCP